MIFSGRTFTVRPLFASLRCRARLTQVLAKAMAQKVVIYSVPFFFAALAKTKRWCPTWYRPTKKLLARPRSWSHFMWQTIKGPVCGSETSKNFSVRLDPGIYRDHALFRDTKKLLCHTWSWHLMRPRMIPGHQRTLLSDLILVSYHLLCERHVHHSVPAKTTNYNRSDLPVLCSCSCLYLWSLAPVSWRGCLWFWDTKELLIIWLCPGEIWL